MRTSVKVATALMFVVLAAYAPAGAPTSVAAAGAQLQSIGPLGFGPNGVMYAADSVAGKIYALDLGAQANGGAPGTANVDNFNQKVAAMLGTDAAQIAITDLAVDARTRNSFVSVMRGQGPARSSRSISRRCHSRASTCRTFRRRTPRAAISAPRRSHR